MGLAIFLRNQTIPNRFRELILACADLRASTPGVDYNAILCSGFFQEGEQSSSFRASQYMEFASRLSISNTPLITIGAYSFNNRSYRLFVDNVRAAGVSLEARLVSRLPWHAKVFIYRQGDIPVLGIIGSSNMTSRAFGDATPFNYEADVVLWNSDIAEIDGLMLSNIEQRQADVSSWDIHDK